MLSLLEPAVHAQRHVRIRSLPAPPRYVAPNFEVIFPCDGIALSVNRWRGCDELMSGTIRLGDWTIPGDVDRSPVTDGKHE